MGNKTILKTSIFGGYNKDQVTQFIDEIIKEKEKLQKDLESQQSGDLEQELEKKRKEYEQLKSEHEEMLKSFRTAADLESEEKRDMAAQDGENKKDVSEGEKVSIRNQMQIPEGTYIIGNEDTEANIMTQMPLYEKKEEAVSPVLNRVIVEEEKREPMKMNPFLQKQIFDIRVGPHPENESQHEERKKKLPDNQSFPYEISAAKDEIAILKKEIAELLEILEQAQMEKQVLKIKLEYANELLMEIFRQS